MAEKPTGNFGKGEDQVDQDAGHQELAALLRPASYRIHEMGIRGPST